MGALSSAQRDSKRDESTVSEPSAGQDEAQEDSAEDKLLQKNGQISSLNGKTESQADDLNVPYEEIAHEDVGSGYVTLKEDGTETTEDLQEGDTSQANTEETEAEETNADGVTVKEDEETGKQSDIEVGFKKMFRFVGFKFTLKKDKVDKIDADEPTTNEQDKKVAISSEDSRDTTEESPVSTNEQEADADETKKNITMCDMQDESKGGDISPETDSEMAISQISEITERNEEVLPDKGQLEEVPQSPEPEELMSPFKRFFTQGIFANFRKKRKEDTLKENKEEELKRTDKEESEKLICTAEEQDSTCICLNISNITPEVGKDVQTGVGDEWTPVAEKELTNSQEQDKVPASPLKRLFRKLSTRRQRDTKPAETSLIEPGEKANEKLQPSSELVPGQKEEEDAKVEEPKLADEDEITDISPEESKKKSDSTVSWESLICLGSTKKRARKTSDSEDASQDKGEELRKPTESPLGSSTEGDYDHLTSSNEQAGSPAGEESGSTWKSLKKLVTPKKKARMEESGSSEHIPSDTEITKDESSCSIKKLIPGRKKKRSEGQQEHTSSDEAGKGMGTDNEDDETPAIVPLSEYEIIEPESLKEITDGTELQKEMQPLIEEDKPKETKTSHDVRPAVLPMPSDYIEDLTDFISKHQQLSDIPEEGIIEESVATPVSSAEWTTQDDTLAEDFVELTADAVTAPEPASEQLDGDETTEMVSAVSQLTESPKTSGNVTPVPSDYDFGKADVILQETAETSSMTPCVMSISIQDKDPEAPYFIESTITAETKVIVAHEKAEATSICIGLLSQEIGDAEVLPSPLVEGISEITEALPTELVSEDLTEGSELAGLATDDVYEVDIKEIKTEMHEAVFLDDAKTLLAETKKELEETSQMHADVMKESKKSEVSPVVQDEVKEYPADVINGNQKLAPVQMAVVSEVQDETLLEEQVITKSMTSVPEIGGPLEMALEEPVHKQPVLCTEITVEGEKEHRLPDVKLSVTDIEQVALAELAETVEQNVIVSIADSTIDEASEITEDAVQVTLAEVVETVTHNVVASRQETAIVEATEIVEKMVEVLTSAVECPETTEAISIVSPVSDSVKVEAVEVELEDKRQMENVASIHYLDGHEIQVEVKSIEIGSAKANVETVPDVATAVDVADIYERVEEIRENRTAQQQIEPTPAEESCENLAEIISYIKMETLLQAEPPCEEKQLNVAVKEVLLSAVSTDECSEFEHPQEVLDVVETESVDTNITIVKNYKPKQGTSDEADIVTLDEAGKQMENTQQLTILQQESAEGECQPLTMDKTEAQPKNLNLEFGVAAHSTEAAAKSLEEDSAMPETKETCKDDEVVTFGTLSEDAPEQKEITAKPEVGSETATDQENLEPVALSLRTEVDRGQQLQVDLVPFKPEENQGTESSLQFCKEEKQAAEDTVKVTKRDSEVAVIHVKETKQSEVILDNNEGSNETKRICQEDVSELKTEIRADSEQHSNAPTLKVKEAAASEMDAETLAAIELKRKTTMTISEPEKVESTEQVTEPPKVAENKSTLTVQPQVMNEHKAEALEVIEPKEETHAVTEVKLETAVVTELQVETPVVTSVVKELEVETPVVTSGLTDLKVETPMVISVVTEPKLEIPVVTSVVKKLEVETPVVTSRVTEPEVETPVVKDINIETPIVISVVTEPDVETSVVTSVVTEPTLETSLVTSAVKMLEVETPVVTLRVTEPEAETSVVKDINIEKHVVLTSVVTESKETPVVASLVKELKVETPVVPSVVTEPEVETLVVKELKVETPVVPPMVTEPEVETSVVKELKVETPVVTSVVTEPKVETSMVKELKVETPVVPSVVTEPEVETPAVKSGVTVFKVETPVVPSVVTEPEVETSVVKELKVETPVVTSVVTEPKVETSVVKELKVEARVVPSVVTEPEIETPVVKSGVTVLKVETPVVPSVVTEPEVETSVVKELKVETPVVTSVVTEPKVETSVVTVLKVETPVVPSVVTEPEVETSVVKELKVETPVVTSVVTEPEVETSVVKELKVETPVVTSVVTEPEVETSVVKELKVETPVVPSVVTEPEVETSVVKELKVETPVVTSVVTEPKVETSVVKELKVETPVVTSVVTEPKVETSVVKELKVETLVVPSVVTEPEVETPVVKSGVTVLKVETSVVTSVARSMVTEPEVETPVVTPMARSMVTEPKVKTLVVTSGVTVHKVERSVVTPELTAPGLERPEVTSVVTEPGVERPVVTSVVTEPGVERPVVTSVVTEPGVERPVVTSVVTEPGVERPVLTSVVTEPGVERPVVTSVVTEPGVERPVVTSVVTEPGVERPVVTSMVTKPGVERPVVTSVVTRPGVERPVVKTVATNLDENTTTMPVVSVIKDTNVQPLMTVPAVAQDATLEEISTQGETPAVAPIMQKPTVVPVLQAPVSKDTEIAVSVEEKDAKIRTPVVVELTKPMFELPVAAETVIQTAVSGLEAELPAVTSALTTETLLQTCMEKKLDPQSPVVSSVKEDKVGSSVLTSVVSKSPVTAIVQTPVKVPVLQTSTVVPTIQMPAAVLLVQKPEVPMELNQTKPETSDAADINTPKIAAHAVTEIKVEVKQPAMKSVITELQVTKEEASVLTSIVEKTATASIINPPTVALVVQRQTLVETPTIVPATEKPTVIQIPTIVPVVQTVGTGVKEAEIPAVAPEVKDIHKEASDAVMFEVKESPIEAVKVTETTEQFAQKECNKDTKSLETVSRGPAEVAVSMLKTAEPLPDVDDDVWEDAVDDIRDDECSITNTVGKSQWTTK
ncbi:uncharacterized protein akap12a [Salminus brasiliensis]|uniref:uncharacterized protein akap12a n=1 Tax=Salminus brasiliensis TaxID=930266 RepID=UPI003B834690